MSERVQVAHYQTHLSHSLLGGWTWSCLCRATGAASTREDANRAFVRHLPAPVVARPAPQTEGERDHE